MVVNGGLAIITNRLKNGDTGATEPKFIGWGTGTTAAAAGNTGLETARAEARTDGTSTRQTTTTANDTHRVVGTITGAGTSAAITEVALFDALTAGNMFSRDTFAVVNVAVGESIEFTIDTVYARV